jgi:hypothetical protein
MAGAPVPDYVVTRTKDEWPDSRYKITGGPPLLRGNSFNAPFNAPTPWIAWSWTIWGAKRKIRKRRALLARTDKIVYREPA